MLLLSLVFLIIILVLINEGLNTKNILFNKIRYLEQETNRNNKRINTLALHVINTENKMLH